MTMLRRAVRPTILATLATLALCGPGSTETRPVGVVASLQGTATVERTAVAEPAPLKFRDDVFVRDRITTGERSVVRILLGGKATVTAREHSVLVITERPGTSTVSLAEGKIAVAVDKTRMQQGEVVEIRTPNAVAAIRGTVVVAEVVSGDGGPASTITVLRGLIDVTRLGVYTRSLVSQQAQLDYRLLAAAVGAAFAGALLGNRFLPRLTLTAIQRTVAAMLAAVALGLMAGLL